MKKLFLILMAVAMCGIAKADDRPIDYNQIPQKAKSFITKHFAKAKVVSSMVDSELFDSKEYTVYMDNGAKVEFRSNGAWKKVDCGMNPVPAGIVPAKIAAYVKNNYPSDQIVKIDVDRTDYELNLSNGFELKFDLSGNFMSMDD